MGLEGIPKYFIFLSLMEEKPAKMSENKRTMSWKDTRGGVYHHGSLEKRVFEEDSVIYYVEC